MAKAKTPGDATEVDAYLQALAHPRKDTVLALRQALLAMDPAIGEAVKWNAPSFHVGEHFATMHLRAKDGVQLILHMGAKKTAMPDGAIDDPAGLLTWRGPDRATVTLRDVADLADKRAALAAVVRQWIARVAAPAGP